MLIIFCAIAINLAYVQLAQTEMQIAVDVGVHAGGRRLGTPIRNPDGSVQTLAEAKIEVMNFAHRIAAMNTVGNTAASIPTSVMEFGRSVRRVREDGTLAPYEFQPTTSNQIPSSFRITSDNLRLRHKFGPFTSADDVTPANSFIVNATSVSTQVDRDVVLVLDRSGSMIRFEDESLLYGTLDDLEEETIVTFDTEYRVAFYYTDEPSKYYYSNTFRNYYTEPEFDEQVAPSSTNRYKYLLWNPSAREREGTREEHGKISQSEHSNATRNSVSRQWFSSNVIYWLEATENSEHTLGDDSETWTDGLSVAQQRAKLSGHMALFAHDHRYRYRLNNSNLGSSSRIDERQAPAFSRWYHLERGVNVFLNVLGGGVDPDGVVSRDGTVQKENVSLLPFNGSPDSIYTESYPDTNSKYDYGLQDDGFPAAFVNDSSEPGYDEPYPGTEISHRGILPTICPYGNTAIGDSLREAVYIIRDATSDDSSARARPFAAKTIVVLTDGDNTVGDDPVDVARDELSTEDVIVHTITFTPGVSNAGKTAMGKVAEFGKGKHYHTDSGEALATIFEEIANNLPTILTQ